MKSQKTPLIVPIIWTVSAIIWFGLFAFDLCNGNTLIGLVIMRGLCAGLYSAAAVLNFIHYAKGKKSEKEE